MKRSFSFIRLLAYGMSAILIAGYAFSESPPTLRFSIDSGKITVAWPVAARDWRLFWSPDLSSSLSRLVTDPVAIVGDEKIVVSPITGTKQFYHLEHQGAFLPFVTIEAEDADNHINGKVVKMIGAPTTSTATPELEASGRGYVELADQGQYLEVPVKAAANTIVLRHCIPDAPTGGGISGTLSLYVNGVFRQKLTLSSKFNWLYGLSGKNGQSNDPTAGESHVFWDETRAFIAGGVNAGDVLRLCKDTGDDAAFYRLDLLDLENVAPPLAPPADGTYLSVTDFGADGSDQLDDSQAIANCIAAAKDAGKCVWMPPGTYYQSTLFTLDGVSVKGAGMWYTNLISTSEGTRTGNVGFTLKGNFSSVSDLYVESSVHTSRGTPGGKPFTCSYGTTDSWSVTNVWITHTNVGFWMSGGTNGLVRGCRVRLTYADGININRGSSNNVVESNHVRGCGDDGIAISSETNNTPTISMNNVVRSNTVIGNWWGHNCDLAGGSGHIIENNYLADNAVMGCMTINLPSSYPMYPLTSGIIRRNTIVRGGGYVYGQRRGAIWIYPGSQTISNVVISDNEITDSIFSGIDLVGAKSQQITFQRNLINNPGNCGVLIERPAIGAGTWLSNVVRCSLGVPTFLNRATNYTITSSDNSWE